MLFAILQKYEFSSKSQQLNIMAVEYVVVCDTAKVRVLKQITTPIFIIFVIIALFAILQKYEFSSKSQPWRMASRKRSCCLRYCKSTSFQANHNQRLHVHTTINVVCDIANVRVFLINHNGGSSGRDPWLSLPPYGGWRCRWLAPPAVGRGRWCRQFAWCSLFFLMKFLASWFYFASLH